MLKWSFAASRWLVQIAFGAVSVFFFFVGCQVGTNHGISSLSVYSLGLSEKKRYGFLLC